MNKLRQDATPELVRKIGYDLLGPIVHRWLLALDQHIAFFDDDDTQFLFCARAGVRIRQLYDLYLQGLGRTPGDNQALFWVSRLAVCKGIFARDSARAGRVIAREYAHLPMRALVKGLFRNLPEALQEADLSAPDLNAAGSDFPVWIRSRSPVAIQVRAYLTQCSEAFDAYLATLMQGRQRGVLIDSGWQGTSQSLLHHAYPEIDWVGLYVGRILTDQHDPSIVDHVIGLLFQGETYDPARPETAITVHRHLFETLLEPNGPSIEEIVDGPFDSVAQAQIAANRAETISPENDVLFLMAQDYLQAHAGLGPAEILARHQKAMPELARVLTQPTHEEALAVFTKDRSADFGKDIDVPVLQAATGPEKRSLEDADSRIQKALWPQGQIALEYTGGIRDELQARVTGTRDDLSYFDPLSATNPEQQSTAADLPERPLVGIITRTKNRPILLRRAADSVARQTYDAYLWVVVNDGGDEQAVRDIIDSCAVDRRKIRLVSNPKSLGMEAASNAGIAHASECDYLLIHDDDDSLHPRFLERAVGYLEGPAGRNYGGLITHSEYISEEIRGDQVIEHGRQPYMDWVRNVQISEMLAQNLFAPISFLYRRNVYDEIGGYNEDLPVLGDWFFNLEFLLRSDIKVLTETLAYYHHRDKGDSRNTGVYSNSVSGGQSKHEEYAAIARNQFIRKYGRDNMLAAGAIQAYFVNDLRHRISSATRTPPPATDAAAWNEIDRLSVLSQILLHIQAHGTGKSRKNVTLTALSGWKELCTTAHELNVALTAPASFDETRYLLANPDVEEALGRGQISSGYSHYIMNGRAEGRNRPTQVPAAGD